MNDNNYVLLPQVKIGFIYNNIQTVVPFVLDESLDVYNLLKKLVDYCNELGARSNELQYILKDLVEFLNNKLNDQRDYINNFLENLHQEWLDYKQTLEDKYDAFTEQVDTLFEQYKQQIIDEYNTELANIRTNNNTLYNNLKTLLDEKITELTNYANSIESNIDSYIDEKDQAIKELITNFQNEFTEYQKTVNAELVELGDTLTQLINTNEQNVVNQINTKTTEIINSLSNVNMEELVNEKMNSYDSEELSDLFTNLYGTLIRITYMDTNTPPTLTGTSPIYHYNPTTNVLTDCTTGNEVPILTESLYLYEGRIFTAVFSSSDINSTLECSFDALYYNGDIVVCFDRSSNQKILIYNKETGDIIYNDTIMDYINKLCIMNNILYYYNGNGNSNIYSLNLETKENTIVLSNENIGNIDNIYGLNNEIYLFTTTTIRKINLSTNEISSVNDNFGCDNGFLITNIDDYIYIVTADKTISRTKDFITIENAFTLQTFSSPTYLFKIGANYFAMRGDYIEELTTNKRINLQSKQHLLINSLFTIGSNNLILNILQDDTLIPIKTLNAFNINYNPALIFGKYIYGDTDYVNLVKGIMVSYGLQEIPYQRSDS